MKLVTCPGHRAGSVDCLLELRGYTYYINSTEHATLFRLLNSEVPFNAVHNQFGLFLFFVKLRMRKPHPLS